MATESERYCRRCDEHFRLSSVVADCPRCGGRLTATVAPTLDIAETTLAGELPRVEVADSDLSARLVGNTFDNYEIQSFLGKGGMAWVFLARHRSLHRPCAIKVLCPELQGRKQDSVEKFVEEARLAASIVHPHIVTVHNIGESSGHHFIELEYVPGQSLQSLVEGREPTVIEATEFSRQACAALAEAHRCGLVHRDFKPANIMVRDDGFAKLADFGLAKKLVEGASDREGLAGTPYFMAPELFSSVRASKCSDVYAVGVALFVLLTGRYPFEHAKWTELAKLHADAPIPDLREHRPHVPESLASLVTACLAKAPSQRPADGSECLAELTAIHRGLRDLRTLVSAAFTGLDVDWDEHDGRVVTHVRFPSGRRQRVVIEQVVGQFDQLELIRISSTCAAVCDQYLRRALELNTQIPHGALAIQEIDGQPHFVVLNSYPRTTCDAAEIRHSVRDVAYWADQVEHALTGDDRF